MAGGAPRASPCLPSAVGRCSAAYGNFLPRGSGTPASAGQQWALLGPWTADCAYQRFGTPLALGFRQGDQRMFENVFGIHEQALLLHEQRIGVLATNLANADTPNYKARDIDFSEVLAQSDGGSLSMRVTQAAHIATPQGELSAGALKYRNPYQASLDGNTVEMPVEQAAFAENNVRYQASLRFISGTIAEMQLAIAGQ